MVGADKNAKNPLSKEQRGTEDSRFRDLTPLKKIKKKAETSTGGYLW